MVLIDVDVRGHQMSETINLAAAWDARVLHLTEKLPRRLGSVVRWLREPSHRLVRVIAAILFTLGGVFSLLPVLGLWMLPLGLGLLAEDLPGMKPSLEKASRWLMKQWRKLRERNARAS
jgi:hypothetical protein